MATFFEDLGKSADDLITKGFPIDGSFKISTETKTDSGLAINTSGRRFFKAGVENVEAVFEPKFNYSAKNLEVTGKLTTSNDFEAGVNVKDVAVKGSKVSFTATHSPKGYSLKPAFEVKNDAVALKASVVYPDARDTKPINAEASVVVAYEKSINAGAKVTYATGHTTKEGAKAATIDYSVRAGYLQPLYQAIAAYTKTAAGHICAASYYQKVSASTTVATSFSVDCNGEKSSPAAVVAGEYKYAADTVVKGKFAVNAAKDLRVGLALQQNLNSSAVVTIGADVNALTLLGTNKGAAHSFGVEIKLK